MKNGNRRNTRAAAACCLAASVLLGTPLRAEETEGRPSVQSEVSSPEELLQRYTETMRAGDFVASAALMHSEALGQFQRVMAELASLDTTGQVARQLFGLAEGQTLSSLKPAEAFATIMKVFSTAVPGMADALKSATAVYLGSVKEGEMVHVVYRSRLEFAGKPVEKIDVLTAKREAGTWRTLLRGDMENMLNGIVQQLKSAPGA